MIFCCFLDMKLRCNLKFLKLNFYMCNIVDVYYNVIGMESMVKLEIYYKNIRYGEILFGWNRK